jgi:hypothetical protein
LALVLLWFALNEVIPPIGHCGKALPRRSSVSIVPRLHKRPNRWGEGAVFAEVVYRLWIEQRGKEGKRVPSMVI